jgi:Na+/H+ antiporter NhaD/arsenite permease-like protein
MTTALIIVFGLVYAAIALEEWLGVNKAGAALVGAGLLWTIYAMSGPTGALVNEQLGESLVATAQIAFFLLGAMAIVEAIDAHDGFAVIGSWLRARSLGVLAIWISLATFFLSAVLDNLTTTLVMVSMLSRLLREQGDRLVLAGMIVIAANAGGAWSPIGDVTTTMLWIGGQVSAPAIISRLFLPSLINMLVPLSVVAWRLRHRPVVAPDKAAGATTSPDAATPLERNLVLTLGLCALLFVPAFKTVTHLPPFLGVLFVLGVLWTIADLVGRGRREPPRVTIAQVLARIDNGVIMFFIGILLALAALERAGLLAELARWLDAEIGRLDLIVLIFGLLSAVVDNVPMVGAAMGMYDIGSHPPDSFLWEFMAYCAGTGGSILIIGSAAGVAAMGLERIGFMWYLRRFGLLAFLGYLAGAIVYLIEFRVLG